MELVEHIYPSRDAVDANGTATDTAEFMATVDDC